MWWAGTTSAMMAADARKGWWARTSLTARTFGVVDALHAMTHDRPYRRDSSLSEALEVVRREAGKQLDPRVVEAAPAMPASRWAELLGCPEGLASPPTRPPA